MIQNFGYDSLLKTGLQFEPCEVFKIITYNHASEFEIHGFHSI